ncbi:hypothetical protein AVEN_205548-1 [Araneus ventricosus]|uniref:Uncharacterized protein n=1 Tax=Araneus ventricosus TaxID=182803 RepID=A0A4Y2JQE9_ARAVE|nr:hypothetical protein AVEN_205548-1 [Araneus ventricosus]
MGRRSVSGIISHVHPTGAATVIIAGTWGGFLSLKSSSGQMAKVAEGSPTICLIRGSLLVRLLSHIHPIGSAAAIGYKQRDMERRSVSGINMMSVQIIWILKLGKNNSSASKGNKSEKNTTTGQSPPHRKFHFCFLA